eukprot:COSAG03_NODE_921_length_5312_cov_57.791099_2_plen_64_part_00
MAECSPFTLSYTGLVCVRVSPQIRLRIRAAANSSRGGARQQRVGEQPEQHHHQRNEEVEQSAS